MLYYFTSAMLIWMEAWSLAPMILLLAELQHIHTVFEFSCRISNNRYLILIILNHYFNTSFTAKIGTYDRNVLITITQICTRFYPQKNAHPPFPGSQYVQTISLSHTHLLPYRAINEYWGHTLKICTMVWLLLPNLCQRDFIFYIKSICFTLRTTILQ